MKCILTTFLILLCNMIYCQNFRLKSFPQLKNDTTINSITINKDCIIIDYEFSSENYWSCSVNHINEECDFNKPNRERIIIKDPSYKVLKSYYITITDTIIK